MPGRGRTSGLAPRGSSSRSRSGPGVTPLAAMAGRPARRGRRPAGIRARATATATGADQGNGYGTGAGYGAGDGAAGYGAGNGHDTDTGYWAADLGHDPGLRRPAAAAQAGRGSRRAAGPGAGRSAVPAGPSFAGTRSWPRCARSCCCSPRCGCSLGYRAHPSGPGASSGRPRGRMVPRPRRQLNRELGREPVVLAPSAAGRRTPASPRSPAWAERQAGRRRSPRDRPPTLPHRMTSPAGHRLPARGSGIRSPGWWTACRRSTRRGYGRMPCTPASSSAWPGWTPSCCGRRSTPAARFLAAARIATPRRSRTASKSLMAAFNAGFLMSNAGGGYYTDDKTIIPLRAGARRSSSTATARSTSATGAAMPPHPRCLDPLRTTEPRPARQEREAGARPQPQRHRPVGLYPR